MEKSAPLESAYYSCVPGIVRILGVKVPYGVVAQVNPADTR